MTDAQFIRCLAVAAAPDRRRLEAIADRLEAMDGVDRVVRDGYMLSQIAELREHVAKLESRMAEVFPQFT